MSTRKTTEARVLKERGYVKSHDERCPECQSGLYVLTTPFHKPGESGVIAYECSFCGWRHGGDIIRVYTFTHTTTEDKAT